MNKELIETMTKALSRDILRNLEMWKKQTRHIGA